MPGDAAQTPLIRNMEIADLAAVLLMEKAFFADAWTENIFRQELDLPQARNLIARYDDREIAGYLNCWLVADEVQLHKIAVRQDRQRQGIASALLAAMLEGARQAGALHATLEVRISNEPAVRLYERFGFTVRSRRPLYYDDTHEDALIMGAELGKAEQHEVE